MGDNGTSTKNISFLFITANVGTLFEDLGGLQEIWINQFIKSLEQKDPLFIALHFQEVGGKDYKSSMQHVDAFIKKLTELEELENFDVIRGYLDEDTDFVDQYTALGNFYFVHEALTPDVSLWSYNDSKFLPINGKIVTESLKQCPEICKEKFEQGFFPDCKWSRKGYTRIRWKIYNKIIEFVNIHLFHDDSNLVAIQSSPSPYSKNRRRALKFVLQRVHEDKLPNQDYFIFGDFNFRLDIKSLIQHHFSSQSPQETRSPDGQKLRLVFRDSEEPEKTMLKIEKKLFQYDKKLLADTDASYQHLKRFNEEISDFANELREIDFTFAPTYPYSENSKEATRYMSTRCPAWCDRVLMSPSAYQWLDECATDVCYDTIGKDVCMGDHKPIYLSFKVDMPSKVPNGNIGQVTTKRLEKNPELADTKSKSDARDKNEDVTGIENKTKCLKTSV